MQAEEIDEFFHAPAGFLGPIGLDPASKEKLKRRCSGCSRGRTWRSLEKHRLEFLHTEVATGRLWSSSIARSKAARIWSAAPTSSTTTCATSRRAAISRWTLAADIRSVNEGESCPTEGCAGKLVVGKAVEVGHIFKLGYKYSESMGARVLDENGKEVTPIMGSYGIGIERILTAAIEQSNDANGFWLPASIAPFTVVVTITNVGDLALRATGEKLAADLEAAGLDVLLDDRDERAGVKFKDADLVGIPYRINVGKKAAAGQVELVTRSTSTSVDVALGRGGGAGEEARGGRKAAGGQPLAGVTMCAVSRGFEVLDLGVIPQIASKQES